MVLLHYGDYALKFANKISGKAGQPSNFEREIATLVLQIFYDFVSQTLLLLREKHNIHDFYNTAIFFQIICTEWKFMNVKTPFKGI